MESFEQKFINPRTAEGVPQTERLEYAREFFEELGSKDERFSGAALVGSTMKGYGLDDESDIDVALYFSDKPTREWVPESEFLGMKSPAGWAEVHTFEKDFADFKKEFDEKRLKEEKRVFDVDTNPHHMDLSHYFKKGMFGGTKISAEDMSDLSQLFYELSYPVIESPNENALMPMGRVVTAMMKTVNSMHPWQKEKLLVDVVEFARYMINLEYPKYQNRVTEPASYDEYFDGRMAMFKQKLQNKFGLEV